MTTDHTRCDTLIFPSGSSHLPIRFLAALQVYVPQDEMAFVSAAGHGPTVSSQVTAHEANFVSNIESVLQTQLNVEDGTSIIA